VQALVPAILFGSSVYSRIEGVIHKNGDRTIKTSVSTLKMRSYSMSVQVKNLLAHVIQLGFQE
jgi:hypothetical protein